MRFLKFWVEKLSFPGAFLSFSLVIFNFLGIVQLFVWTWCCNTLLSYIYIYIYFFLSKYDYSLNNSLFSLFLLPFHLCLVFCLLLVLLILGSG
ncbi:unnamed protein product, partial [Vitis vinifera]|uniref:Uncharacterized protein n=1 Tax=Vitis vinifera TaxID=29760 RepID=D7TYA7_VITVI